MEKIFILLAAVFGLAACGGTTAKKTVDVAPADVTQVLYFHGRQRCITCNAIEKLTKEVVDSLANDKIALQVIDITQDEAMADKYEITWSSLLLVRGGRVVNLTDMGFGYAKNQPQAFKAKLTEAIEKIAE